MSDSTSQQQQTSNYTDNRSVLGQDALYANNGARVTISNTTTDAGATKNALDFATGATGRVLDFATSANAGAIGAVSSATTQALGFAADSQSQAYGFGNTVLSKVLDQVGQTQQLVAGAYADAQGQTGAAKNLIYAAMAVVALVAFVAVKGKG